MQQVSLLDLPYRAYHPGIKKGALKYRAHLLIVRLDVLSFDVYAFTPGTDADRGKSERTHPT